MNFSTTDCKNCYKCVRTCDLKAIEVINDSAHILTDRCVACGHCLVVCPQNAREVKSHLHQVMEMLESEREVIVSLAPAYRGYFEKSDAFVAALRKMGFSRIEETAVGAEVVTCAYETYIQQTKQRELITTCCPSTVRLIERYYSDLIPHMIPIVSPMIAHGKMIKGLKPKAYTVFIGPCISKIAEAMSEDLGEAIDAVLTFDEVMAYLEEHEVRLEDLPGELPDTVGTIRGIQYPRVGGVLSGLQETLQAKELEVLHVHGMAQSIDVLEALREGKLKNVCIEINSCTQSCLAGPGGHNQAGSVFTRLQSIGGYLRENKVVLESQCSEVSIYQDIPLSLTRVFKNKQVPIHTATEAQIKHVFESMGKLEKKDELNCGACGYQTCREKAIAVINGMSQIEMCLPYTRSIAERMSNEIFYHSPNSIIMIDRDACILNMNPQAERRFGYEQEKMKHQPINIMMDDTAFKEALQQKKSRAKEKIILEKYDFMGYRDLIYLEKQQALLILFTDITEEEKRKQALSTLKGNTLDLTQSIIDKQMRVAQEIASLLGETTAETKVAIMKLKHVLQEEGEC